MTKRVKAEIVVRALYNVPPTVCLSDFLERQVARHSRSPMGVLNVMWEAAERVWVSNGWADPEGKVRRCITIGGGGQQ